MPSYPSPYGDLSALDAHRDLLDTVGGDLLADVAQSYLALPGTSAAIYEVNGDYATAPFTSDYCRLLAQAPRRRCDTGDDRAALDSGRRHCHESCWAEAARIAVETGQPFDLCPCRGGIDVYAVPIVAEGRTIGAIRLGYGTPPTGEATLAEIAARYGVDVAELRRAAEAYHPHPDAVIEAAKRNLHATARLVAEMYLRRKAGQSWQRRVAEAELMQRVHEALGQGAAMDEVLRLVAEGARALFAGHAATVYFLSDDRRHLSLQNWALPDKLIRGIEKLTGLDVRHIPLPLVEGGHYWRVIEERRASLLDRPEQIEALVAELTAEHPALTKVVPAIVRLLGHRAVLIAPLVAGGEVVGVMDLGSRRRLDEEDRYHFQLLATRMGLIIERARLFEQVTALEEFNERVLSSIHQGVIVLDTEGRIRYLNDFVKTRYGWSSELIGQDIFEYRPVYRQAGLYDAFRQAVDTGEPVEKLRVAHPDRTGRQLVRDFYGYPLREEGRLTGVVVVVNDVTAEHCLEEKLAAIHELGQELVLTRDEERIIETVLDAAERLLEFQIVAFMLVDEERNALCVAAERGFPSEVKKMCLPLDGERGITVAVARSGETIYLPDVTADARYVKGHLESRSELAVPLKVEERVIGVLNVESKKLDAFTETDRRLLSTLADQAALAIESARLYRAERRQREVADALREAGLALVSTLDADQVLSQLLEQIGRVIPYDSANVMEIEGDTVRLTRLRGYERYGVAEQMAALRFKLDEVPNLRRMFTTGQPHVVADTRADPDWFRLEGTERIHSWAGAPIVVRGQVVGFFSLDKDQPGFYTEEHADLLAAFAAQAAIAIENAGLFQAERQRAREMAVLNEISRALGSTLDVDAILHSVSRELGQLISFDRASIAFVNPESRTFTVVALDASPGSPLARGVTMPWKDSAASEDVLANRPHVTGELSTETTFPAERLLYQAGFRSRLNVPLAHGDRVIGSLNLASRSPAAFGPDALRLLQHVARHTATALENARLFQAARHEIAERKRTEEALRESEEKYRTILDSIEDGYFEVDIAGNFTFFNDSLCRIIGYSRDEMMGMNNRQYMDEENAKKVFRAFNQVYTTGEPTKGFDWEIVRKDGTKRFIETSVSLMKNSEGEPIGFRGMARDVTERQQMQARLMQAEKLAAVGELVAGVAHELNNPLTSVLGYAQLLQRQPVEERVRHDLATIYREARRSARIVNNLLAFARQRKPERCYVNVNGVVEEALELLAYQLRTDNVEVVRRLDPALPPTMADPNQLEQVFVNLVTNARQAMAEAHGRGTLTVTTQLMDEDRLRVVFRDDGPGIPRQAMGKLFDPFFTTKPVGQGTGLGLSICYGLVAEHGGRIWVESEEGKGATFTVELPVEEEDVSWAEEALAQVEAPPTRGRRILVVDDEEPIIGLLTDVLQEAGHRVVGVTDGGAALRALETGEYDLIISDLKMPGLDGRQLYAHLKAERPDVVERLVFTTGDVASPESQRFLAETGCRYLAKPFDLDVVEVVVSDMLDAGSDTTHRKNWSSPGGSNIASWTAS